MTSKARARGGNAVQATFLFENEPNEHMPMVASLDPPRTRSQRTSRSTSSIDVTPVEVTRRTEPPKARAPRTAQKTVVADAGSQAVVAPEPRPAAPTTTSRATRKPRLDIEPVEPVVVVPEAPVVKRRASKAVPPTDMTEAADSLPQASPPKSALVGADEPKLTEGKKARGRRATVNAATTAEAPLSEAVAADRSVPIETEPEQVKATRKRRVPHTTAISTTEPEEIALAAPAEATVISQAVQLAEEAATEQATVPTPRRSARVRRANEARSTDVTEMTAIEATTSVSPTTEPPAPAKARGEAEATSAPEPKRRKRTAPTPPASEAEAPAREKRPRQVRSREVPEEPKTSAAPMFANTQRDLPAGPMFLMSYDDSPKRTLAEKIEAAVMAYQSRFARRPNLVLVNPGVATEVEVADVAIERRSTVPPNNFWAGMQPTVRPATVD